MMLLLHNSMFAENKIDLSGKWHFQIDSLNVGISERWFKKVLSERVKLPGSMAENGKGEDISVHTKWTGMVVDQSWYNEEKYARYRKKENVKIPFWLQPEHHYIGAAWYQKEIYIPEDWNGKRFELFLERCHWETIVWIDNQKVGLQNSLATAHVYDLTDFLLSGKHQLTIRVDNRVKEIDPGQNSHSISDHTQSNWNGIVGKLNIKAFSPVYIENVKLYPDVAGKKVMVNLNLKNRSNTKQLCKLTLCAKKTNHKPNKLQKEFELTENKELKIEYPMGDSPLLWDEFNPNIYTMNLKLESQAGVFIKQINFGMREFRVEGTRFTINGRPIFLRGTLECAIFPKTGYPATDVEEWIRIFNVIKAHGLNHMRFHSWCPPEAAFIAADQVGIYLQVECSSWANQGSSLGDGKPIDDWIYREAKKILENYGNHPSFCMMAYGNEPAGKNQSKFLSGFVSHWKKNDPRRVYTSGAGWPPIPENDYYNSPDPRIQRWGAGLRSIINSKPPQTLFDYRDILAEKFADKPIVSHEIGQWCVYPNFKEMSKYTGVLKAKNFEIFKETLEENHMGHLAEDFLMASGKLQVLCYKAEIEAALRTPGMAGFQLLDLHDFPGQGTALVGVLDAFWEEKGYISPEDYNRFCNQTVPLARFAKRIFLNNEKISAEIEVAHFGENPLKNVIPKWQLMDERSKVIFEGLFNQINIPIGNEIKLGKIEIETRQFDIPQKLILKVDVANFINQWDIWVYPAKHKAIDFSQIYVTSTLDDITVSRLEKGSKVFLSLKRGSLKPEKGGDIKVGFSSIFWNTAWTRKQAPHTLGIQCDPEHPALAEFPTEYHSNWQWWDAMSHSHAFMLDEFSSELQPIVRIIDDWFENRRLALIFEAKVNNGKMIVSGIDLISNVENRPEAQQLRHSIQKYMISEKFNPQHEVDIKSIRSLIKL
jgi:hypothetical protein